MSRNQSKYANSSLITFEELLGKEPPGKRIYTVFCVLFLPNDQALFSLHSRERKESMIAFKLI